jgi:hypothetical protein
MSVPATKDWVTVWEATASASGTTSKENWSSYEFDISDKNGYIQKGNMSTIKVTTNDVT